MPQQLRNKMTCFHLGLTNAEGVIDAEYGSFQHFDKDPQVDRKILKTLTCVEAQRLDRVLSAVHQALVELGKLHDHEP